MGSVSAERLLTVCVLWLVAVYGFYWTATRRREATPPTVTRPRPPAPVQLGVVDQLDHHHHHHHQQQQQQQQQVRADGRPPACSFAAFRSVARRRSDGYIPGSGTWRRNNAIRLRRAGVDRFEPSVCRLRHGRWIPDDELATCLRRQRVRYIAIVADSNGRWYLRTLRRLLSEAPTASRQRRIVCGPVIRHNGLNYSSYRSPQVATLYFTKSGGMEIVKKVAHTRLPSVRFRS